MLCLTIIVTKEMKRIIATMNLIKNVLVAPTGLEEDDIMNFFFGQKIKSKD